jgi:uncharacterized membrane protein
VPDRCLAGAYPFRLSLATESGLSGESSFDVVVYRTYGFGARLLNANATAGASGAVFNVAVTNLGNHPDSCQLWLQDIPAAWAGEERYPQDLPAFGERLQRITVVPDASALAGDYSMLLKLEASWGTLQTFVLSATVERVSDLRFSVPERFQAVDAGSDACFPLALESRSNFPESVAIEARRLPEGWGWFLASAPLEVGPFSNASGSVVLQVPAGAPAGYYTVDIVAYTPAWKSLSSVTVEVRAQRSFTAALDADRAVLLPGESRTFTVTVHNSGNCGDNYLLSCDGPLAVYFPRNLVGVAGGSSEDLLLVVTASGTMPSGVHTLALRVSSVSDPSVERLLTLRIRVEKVTDLRLVAEDRSSAQPGTSGVFWISAANHGSEQETVALSAPGLSAWGLELPALTVPPGETVQVPVYYKVPDGLDGGSYELRLEAGTGDRSWTLTHAVDVPAPAVTPVQGPTARSSPSLLPAVLCGIALIIVVAALALFLRSRRKNREMPPAPPSEARPPAPAQQAPPPPPYQPEQSSLSPPPPWYRPPGQ